MTSEARAIKVARAAETAEVAGVVRDYLTRTPYDGLSIEVLDKKVRRINGWWYVPVQPSSNVDRVTPYYEYLAEIEEQIDEERQLNILLVPTLAGEQPIYVSYG